MKTSLTEAEEYHRTELLRLARNQIAMPNWGATDQLAEHSRITDPRARELAFDELCRAVAHREENLAEDIVTTLRGAL